MTGYGIDVSEWQGEIDHQKVKDAGVDFEIARSAYGLLHPDPFFERNKAEAGRVGLTRGAYAWLRVSQDVVAQADRLAEAAADTELAPWCDFERQPSESYATVDGLPPETALGLLDRFLNELHARDGRVPTLYCGSAFWRSLPGHADPKWTRYPLAIAHYTTRPQPDVPEPWTSWAFWQRSSAGQVPGIPGPVDIDLSSVPLVTASPADPQEHPMGNLNAPIAAIVADPAHAGDGYWQVGADAGLFAYGGAAVLDHTFQPSSPITSAAATPTGLGLWLTGADGAVYAVGDAHFHGHAPDSA